MRRAVAVGAAVILAAVGTFLLVSFVRGAEERALEGEELVKVLVVDAPVAEGTGAELLSGAVVEKTVPAKVAASGAVDDLEDLAGRVAGVDLVPGEQLIGARFVTSEAYNARTRIEVPPDLLQFTLSLDPARAVGGQLLSGDHVAVVASFEQFAYDAIEPSEVEEAFGDLDLELILTELGIFIVNVSPIADADGESGTFGQPTLDDEGAPVSGLILPSSIKTPHSTHIIGHKILVTSVQVEEQPADDPETQGYDLAPTGNLLITLAADPATAEAVIFAAEHGTIWLAIQDPEAEEAETDIRTRGNVYE